MLVFPYGIQGGLRRLARQFLSTPPTRPGPPGQRQPAGEHAEDVDAPYRRPPVSEHQEEGTS